MFRCAHKAQLLLSVKKIILRCLSVFMQFCVKVTVANMIVNHLQIISRSLWLSLSASLKLCLTVSFPRIFNFNFVLFLLSPSSFPTVCNCLPFHNLLQLYLSPRAPLCLSHYVFC